MKVKEYNVAKIGIFDKVNEMIYINTPFIII